MDYNLEVIQRKAISRMIHRSKELNLVSSKYKHFQRDK